MQIREHAAANPDKPAIIMHPSGTVLTFADLEARANRLAHFFRKHGLREGDTVAILMENNEHFHAVMWAARRCGLYYVPINTHLTAAEAAYIIDNSNAKAVVGSAALRKTCENLAEHDPGQPLLRGDGTGQAGAGRREHRAHPVACVVEDETGVARDRLAQCFVVRLQGNPHRFGVGLPPSRRALDICKEEGHDA